MKTMSSYTPDNTVVCQVRRARVALVVETEEGEGEEGRRRNRRRF